MELLKMTLISSLIVNAACKSEFSQIPAHGFATEQPKEEVIVNPEQVLEGKPKAAHKIVIYGAGVWGGFKIPDIELPNLVLDLEADDFSVEWKFDDTKHVTLVYKNGDWWAGLEKLDDVEEFVAESKFETYAIQGPDSMPMSKLNDVIDGFIGSRIIELKDENGKTLELLLDDHCSGVLPEVEPMLLVFKETGVTLNKSEFVIYPALKRRINEYVSMAESNGVKGEIQLYLGEQNKGVTFGKMMSFLTKSDAVVRVSLMRGCVIIKGGSENKTLELLPSSPHVKEHRWIDRRVE